MNLDLLWELLALTASLNRNEAPQCVNRAPGVVGNSVRFWICFASHGALTIRGVEPAVGIPKEGAATGAPVGLGRRRQGEFRRCAQRGGAVNDVGEVVAALRPRGKIRVQQARGLRGCCSMLGRTKTRERVGQARVCSTV